MQTASRYGLDLVEVAPHSSPPVCKIMDYGKFRYQEAKKAHEARKKSASIQVKEVKIRPKTDKHDFEFKLKHIRRFLEQKNKAKVTVLFRGREISHPELGHELMKKVIEGTGDIGIVEQAPKLEGRNMTMILSPKS